MANTQRSRIRESKKTHPDRLPLGTVREGSTVEASVRTFFDTKNATGLTVDATPPKFVLIEDIHVGKPEEGSSGGTTFCDVFLSINTEHTGNYSGRIHIQLGNQRARVPISATVLQNEPDLTKVLIVESPFHRLSTDDASVFRPLSNIAKSCQIDISYMRHIPKELSGFNVILLAEAGLLSVENYDLLNEFVDSGGRLILTGNYFFRGSVTNINSILECHGLYMEDREYGMAGEILEVDASYMDSEDPLMHGIQNLAFHRPSPIKVNGKSIGKILVKNPLNDDEGFVAVSRNKGEVVVLGQSLWWSWINRAEGNARLLQNMITSI